MVRQQAVKTSVLRKAMNVNVNELLTKDPAQQLLIAKETGGVGLLVDVMKTAEDVDSDSDSSVDEEVKARRHKQHVIRGTAKPTAWAALKDHMVAPKVNANTESQWQTLMDDTWGEFMVGIKARQRSKAEARMFRIKKALYTEEEVTEWLLDAEMEAKRGGYFGMKPPSKRVIKRIIDSVCDNKVQQFGAQDSDEEEEQEEMDEIVEAARDIKAAAVGKMQRYIRREIGWQTQTLAWQKAVTDATVKMEEELVMTYQTIKILPSAAARRTTVIADPAMRERMWATMQAKQALRAALQNTARGGGRRRAGRALPRGGLQRGRVARRGFGRGADRRRGGRSPARAAAGRARPEGALARLPEPSAGSSIGSGVPSGSGATPAEGKKASHHKPAADPNARTTTTSSMRRHRAGKKAKGGAAVAIGVGRGRAGRAPPIFSATRWRKKHGLRARTSSSSRVTSPTRTRRGDRRAPNAFERDREKNKNKPNERRSRMVSSPNGPSRFAVALVSLYAPSHRPAANAFARSGHEGERTDRLRRQPRMTVDARHASGMCIVREEITRAHP